jgi:hypothetical protein
MLQGLPRSKELSWWSTNSSRSFSCSSASGTSCALVSCGSVPVGSSWTPTSNSSYDPVWCNSISKYANGALDAMVCNDHDDTICRWTHWDLWYRLEAKPFYKVVNIIPYQLLQIHVIYCILLYYNPRYFYTN